jgi:hypothetical protein
MGRNLIPANEFLRQSRSQPCGSNVQGNFIPGIPVQCMPLAT